jgi:hypothetical protein
VVKWTDRTARKRRATAGIATVEAVIVLPVMLMLVFGIAEFGISFTRWNSLTNAVREGARAGVVFRSPCDAGSVEELVRKTVSDFAASSGVEPGDISFPLINGVEGVYGACDGSGTQLTVAASVKYDFVLLDGITKVIPGGDPLPSIMDLSARTVMRNE